MAAHETGVWHTAMAAKLLIYLREVVGWGTWIRTKIDGVRVRCSTVELFPSKGSGRGPRAAEAVSVRRGHCIDNAD